AHQLQDLGGGGAATVRLPAVRPLVVAGGVEDGGLEAVEERALALLECAPAVAAALRVAHVDRECGCFRVDGRDQTRVQRVVGGDRVGRVAQGDEGERRR